LKFLCGRFHGAIKMRELLDQVMVLDQDRSGRTRGVRVLIVGDRGSAIGWQNFPGCHHFSPLDETQFIRREK
jgi:hypothetical protein